MRAIMALYLNSIVQRNRMRALLFHHIQRVPVEDTHQPGPKGTTFLETWQPTPGKQKSALRYLLCQQTMMAEPQSRCHSDSMVSFPETSKRLWIAMSRLCNEIVFAGNHYFSSPL